MQKCKKGASSLHERRCTANEVGVCPDNYTKWIRYLDVSRRGPDRSVVSPLNKCPLRSSSLTPATLRSRLTCSGAVRAGKNAAARCSISCRRIEGAGRLETPRVPAGLLIAITVNNLARQEAKRDCIGEKRLCWKALFCHADRELSCIAQWLLKLWRLSMQN